MTDRKNTKRALFASVISMLLCVTMLIGSTFAWFTDNAQTGVNTIEAGTLRVDLVDENDASLEGKSLVFDKAGANEYWEPGQTWTLQDVFVKNNGNLALKYRITITGIQGDAELNEVITWTIKVGDTAVELNNGVSQEFSLAANTKSDLLSISGTMDQNAGNKYQGMKIEGISIKVEATQDTVEHDSNNNTYDENAEYGNGDEGDKPAVTEPITSAQLMSLINESTTGVVELTGDVVVSETVVINENVTLISKNDANFVVAEGFNGDAISVAEGANLTIDGVNLKNIVLDYTSSNPALVTATTGAKVTFKNVSVTGCTAHIVNGTGAEFVFDAGTVMTGNAFTKKNGQGGSVATISGGKIVINDGVLISGNTSAYARDGLFAAIGNGDIVMNGGKISNNDVTNGTVGSVLYIQGTNGSAATASITMNGGEISNNKGILASAVASRWCNGGTCSITLNAGTIKGNTTTSDSWNSASVFYRCDTTIGADMVIDGVVYGDEDAKNGWTLTDNRN